MDTLVAQNFSVCGAFNKPEKFLHHASPEDTLGGEQREIAWEKDKHTLSVYIQYFTFKCQGSAIKTHAHKTEHVPLAFTACAIYIYGHRGESRVHRDTDNGHVSLFFSYRTRDGPAVYS